MGKRRKRKKKSSSWGLQHWVAASVIGGVCVYLCKSIDRRVIDHALIEKRKEDEMLKKVREQYSRAEIEDYSTSVVVDWLEGNPIRNLEIKLDTTPIPPPKKVSFSLETPSLPSTPLHPLPLSEEEEEGIDEFNVVAPTIPRPPAKHRTKGTRKVIEKMKKHVTKGFNFVSPLGPGTFEKTALGTTRSMNKTEEYTRDVFEFIFRKSFASVRPKWLTSPATGRRCELDGYLEKVGLAGTFGKSRKHNSLYTEHNIKYIGLAFEYDGDQHAKYKPNFHKSEKDFVYQVVRDRWKDDKVKEQGVILIRIPHTVKKPHICEYICKKLDKAGLEGYAQILREHIN